MKKELTRHKSIRPPRFTTMYFPLLCKFISTEFINSLLELPYRLIITLYSPATATATLRISCSKSRYCSIFVIVQCQLCHLDIVLLSFIIVIDGVEGVSLSRESTADCLVVPSFKLSTIIDSRTFKVAAAQTWNYDLPEDVTSSST